MKNIPTFILVAFISLSCNNKSNDLNRNIKLNDTITTSSGLKYIFLKEGEGRKIEVGSKVKAYYDLYINDVDSIVESTSTEKDSVFEFIHGKTPLIVGFSELNNYLIEGDELIAIIPDSLAYGKEGNETLLYNPYIVKHVAEPKDMLSDTLYIITSNSSAKDAISYYEKVMNSDLKNNYHTDISGMTSLLEKLMGDTLNSDMEYLANYFIKKTEEVSLIEYFKYFKLKALEGQGKYNDAITLIEPLTEGGYYKDLWIKELEKLKEKLDD